MQQIKQRQSNLELLRIITMLLIVMHHYSIYSGFSLYFSDFCPNKIFIQLASSGGRLGIDLFILISGYFMVKSRFKMKKLVTIVAQVVFYSLLFYFVSVLSGATDFGIRKTIKTAMPITFSAYWFPTVYVVLYALSPFLNKFINAIGKKTHFKLIAVCVLLWSVMPTFTTGKFGFSNLTWFVTLYLIAAYLRLYPNKYANSLKFNAICAAAMIALIAAYTVIIDVLAIDHKSVAKRATYLTEVNMLPIIILAVALFLMFKNLNIKNNRFINTVASSTFGVYLFHENGYVRPLIWDKLFHGGKYFTSALLPVHTAASVLIVFCAGIVIDKLRIVIVEKPFLRLYDFIAAKADPTVKKIRAKLSCAFNKFIEAE